MRACAGRLVWCCDVCVDDRPLHGVYARVQLPRYATTCVYAEHMIPAATHQLPRQVLHAAHGLCRCRVVSVTLLLASGFWVGFTVSQAAPGLVSPRKRRLTRDFRPKIGFYHKT